MSDLRRDDETRQHGRIEERGKTLREIVYAGTTLGPASGSSYAGRQPALRAVFSAPVHALDEWMRTSEIEDSIRQTYEGYINRTIRPVLGDAAANKITVRMLADPRQSQRHARRGRTLGLDQFQPRSGRTQASPGKHPSRAW